MTLHRGVGVQRDGSNNGWGPLGHRLVMAGNASRSVTGSAQPGVLVDGMGPVVTGLGSMAYSVRACVVRAKQSDANGVTESANDSPVTVSTTAAPGSNSRIDTVYAVQRHVSGDGTGTTSNAFEVGVVQGSVDPIPSPRPDADLPPGAVRLADVVVTAGATTTSGLTFERKHEWVGGNGGVVPEAQGSRFGWVWDGLRRARVALGLVIAGQSDAIRAQSYLQMGRASGTTGPFGDLTINLPQAYSVAIIDAVATDANPITGGGAVQVKFRKDASSSTTLTVRASTGNGGVLASVAIEFTYIAWGY